MAVELAEAPGIDGCEEAMAELGDALAENGPLRGAGGSWSLGAWAVGRMTHGRRRVRLSSSAASRPRPRGPMIRSPLPRLLGALALIACAGMVAASAAGAATTLTWKQAKAERLAGTGPDGYVYASDRIVWLECGGKATAVMAGWTGPKAPIAMIYSHLVNTNRNMGLAVRRPMAGGRFQGRTLCLKGAKAKAKEVAGASVTCGRKQIALGVPIDGFYWTEPVASKPVGARGWTTTGQGNYSRSKAICVPAKALRKVQRTRKAASFPVGRATATVKASCKGGRRPVSWGFEASTMEQNGWRSAGSSVAMTVPFISAALPQGKAGWRLTFATPDGAPARATTSLAVHVTCAVPA